jgi:phospholipase C
VLVINYDEWGGFFDHVQPRKAPDVSKKTALRGFRTPALTDEGFEATYLASNLRPGPTRGPLLLPLHRRRPRRPG